MKVKVLPYDVSEELKKEIFKRLTENCKIGKTQFDKIKYIIAKTLAEKLSQLEWVKKIYYTEISSGEFIEGRDFSGRDIDLAIIADESKVPVNGHDTLELYAETLEEELGQLLVEILRKLGRECDTLKEIAEKHGLIELHMNDMYAKIIEKKEKMGRISDTNAMRLYP